VLVPPPPPPAPPTALPAPPAPAEGVVPVGLLLPLSGPSAALGQAMLNAAQMALFDVADNPLQLLIRDTKGDPQTAAAAARSAIEGGARLLLGPLLAAEVEAVKPVALDAHVPVIAFSTATQLASEGTYLIGFQPQQEIGRVIAFAHARGLDRVAVLAPRSPYGDIAIEAAQDAVAANHASLAQIGRYSPDDPPAELRDAVQRFAAGGVTFDALLIAEGGAKLREIAPLLAFDGIDPDKVKFLGTGLWDEPGLGTEPALEGGWYAAPDPSLRAAFTERFTALYKRPPLRLATLGYDATALAGVLARNGADFSAAALTNPSGFAGLDGIFRLLPSGLVQRGLAVLEVHRGAATVLDPEPNTFEQLGE
jgi:ABC-type branched-subunit amino acid transport system substrate-binding protein